MHASDKKLNEMNRLGDMAHFPALVNAGATANILITICITWLLVSRYRQIFAPALWVAIVLVLNLLPVFLLRLSLSPTTVYRSLGTMDFFHDQHKFSDWVYLAASANMAFWILAAWSLFSVRRDAVTLLIMMSVAFVVTFSPVLLRSLRSPRHTV